MQKFKDDFGNEVEVVEFDEELFEQNLRENDFSHKATNRVDSNAQGSAELAGEGGVDGE